MIKAYLASLTSLYEGEDFEIRYSIYENEELLKKKSINHRYRKPAYVGHYALRTLLKELQEFKGNDILIIINDGALNETIRGTSTTKNRDLLNIAKDTREEINKIGNITLKDVSGSRFDMVDWDEKLKP